MRRVTFSVTGGEPRKLFRSPRSCRARRMLVVVGLAATGLVASGAGSSAASTQPKSSTTFPVSVTAANGTVRIAARPERIISLSPTATDMLFAVGAGTQVVAVDNDSTYPASAPRTSLSGVTPNVEAISKYRPDLVVISYAPAGLVANLEKLKIPVLLETAPSNLAGTYAQIEALGTATGHRATGDSVVSTMRAKIRTILSSSPHFSPALSYYYELSQDYYSATSSTFIGAVLGQFGLHDIADAAKDASSGYPQLSAEYIVKADPQVIFLADTICCGQSKKTVAARAGWSVIAAVKSGAVVSLNDSIASQWGPRIVTLYSDVRAALVALKAKTSR